MVPESGVTNIVKKEGRRWLIPPLSSPSNNIPEIKNLIQDLDFTEWTQDGVFGMSSVTQNTFTNEATASVALNVGAEVGKTYRVTVDVIRPTGALRMYFSDEPTITTPEVLADLTTGETVIELPAYGPWIVFRASVGNSTSVVNKFIIEEV